MASTIQPTSFQVQIKEEHIVKGIKTLNETFFTLDNITNVDVGNLFNKDYNTFIDEYIQLCNSLDLEYKGNSVRAFILLWLEKQERLING